MFHASPSPAPPGGAACQRVVRVQRSFFYAPASPSRCHKDDVIMSQAHRQQRQAGAKAALHPVAITTTGIITQRQLWGQLRLRDTSIDQGCDKYSSWALLIPGSTICAWVNGKQVRVVGFACGKPCLNFTKDKVCPQTCMKQHDISVHDPAGLAAAFQTPCSARQQDPRHVVAAVGQHVFEGELCSYEIAHVRPEVAQNLHTVSMCNGEYEIYQRCSIHSPEAPDDRIHLRAEGDANYRGKCSMVPVCKDCLKKYILMALVQYKSFQGEEMYLAAFLAYNTSKKGWEYIATVEQLRKWRKRRGW